MGKTRRQRQQRDPGRGDRGNKGTLVVGVHYRPPEQGEPPDEAFFLQLQETSRSQSLILLGVFNHPNI